MIEIIVAPGKITNIPLYKGDDAQKIVNNFGMTFNLGQKAKDNLFGIIN